MNRPNIKKTIFLIKFKRLRISDRDMHLHAVYWRISNQRDTKGMKKPKVVNAIPGLLVCTVKQHFSSELYLFNFIIIMIFNFSLWFDLVKLVHFYVGHK